MAHVPDTDPYPWPYDGVLDGARTALVVAGAQPHWVARSAHATEVLATLTHLATAVRRRGGIVVALRHGLSPALAAAGRRPHLPEVGTDGWAVCLGGWDADHVVDTSGLNGFHGSELDGILGGLGRDHLLLGGFCAELTLDTTLRGANDRGYECLVVADACAFADPDLGAHALSSVTMSGGIFGALGTSAAVIGALGPGGPAPTSSPSTISNPPEEDR
jgi:nicotinamidase-related amidase